MLYEDDSPGGCFERRIIDDLSYDYGMAGGTGGSSRLTNVTDNAPTPYRQDGFKPGASAGDEYDYDLNGNLVYDPHKGLTIDYHYLNLPKLVTANSGGSITMEYDAGGRKLRQTQTDGTTRYYINGVEYLDNKIESIQAADGRLVAEQDPLTQQLTGFAAEYHLKDHLGNVRLTFIDTDKDAFISAYDDPDTAPNELEVTSESHYYPFGLQMQGDWFAQQQPENRYLYNGKELTEDLDLNWLDYGARWYDPAVGRWNAVDPLAENYTVYSPYNYTLGNPISFIDPDGMRVSLFDKMESMGANHGPNSNSSDIETIYRAPNNGQDGNGGDNKTNNSNAAQHSYGGSLLGVYGGGLRMYYMATSLSFKYKFQLGGPALYDYGGGITARTMLKKRVRALTLNPWRSMLNKHYQINTPIAATKPRFWKTNRLWNLAGGGSLGLGLAGAGMSIYNIANSSDPLQQTMREGFTFTGAWIGMKLAGPLAMRSRNPYIGGAIIATGSILGGLGSDYYLQNMQKVNNIIDVLRTNNPAYIPLF